MNRFGEVVSAVNERRRLGPLSRRVVKASRLQELLQYLAGSTSKGMGNQQAAPASTLQQEPGVSSTSRAFQWSRDPLVTTAPPEFLIKLAKVISNYVKLLWGEGAERGHTCQGVCSHADSFQL